jgi:hypothetical protein
LEVIPMISKAYRATRVNQVDWDRLARGHDGWDLTVGVDVGKQDLWPVVRWADGSFERPWRVKNPLEIPTVVTLIRRRRVPNNLANSLLKLETILPRARLRDCPGQGRPPG